MGMTELAFTLPAVSMVALVVLLLLKPLRQADTLVGRTSHDAAVYRAQLLELERDAERGVIEGQDFEVARLEIARKLLKADDGAGSITSSVAPRWSWPLVLFVPLLAAGVYTFLGQPGLPDRPLSMRQIADPRPVQAAQPLTQTEAEEKAKSLDLIPKPEIQDIPGQPSLAELVAKAEAKVAAQPQDYQGHLLLSRAQAHIGKYAQSWRNAEAALIGMPDLASAPFYSQLGETMILAAGGYVSPRAEATFEQALELEPENARARHYIATARAQKGQHQQALTIWLTMLSSAPPGTAWTNMVRERAIETASLLGIDPLEVLPDIPGPNADDIAAAAQMSQGEQMVMIEGMVASLAARLEEDPNDLQGWVRLIRAYGVLGKEEKLKAALAQAHSVFTENSRALEILGTLPQ